MKTLRKGFTIVELVIVIAVIAILAGVLIPTFSGVVSKANASAALTTARNTLDNALLMSSTASLPGKKADQKHYRTVFLVNGYAFGYNGNALESIDYPGYNESSKNYGNTQTQFYHTETGHETFNTFNAILISSSNYDESLNKLTGSAEETILNATDLESITITVVDDNYYVNYVAATTGENPTPASYDAIIYLNSDFAKDIVVLTTFGK